MACVLSSLLSVTDAHEIFSAPSRAHLFAPWQPDGHWYAVNARRITPPALALFFPSVIFLWVCSSSPLHFVTSPLRTVDETTDREQIDWSVAWTEHSPHGLTNVKLLNTVEYVLKMIFRRESCKKSHIDVLPIRFKCTYCTYMQVLIWWFLWM